MPADAPVQALDRAVVLSALRRRAARFAPRTMSTSPVGIFFVLLASAGHATGRQRIAWIAAFIIGFGTHFLVAILNARRVIADRPLLSRRVSGVTRTGVGVAWGIAAPILTPDATDTTGRLLIMLVLAVVGVGGGIIITDGNAAVAQFIVGVMAPVAVLYLLDGGTLGYVVVPGSMAVVGITIGYGAVWNRFVYEATESRLAVASLAERLEQQFRVSEQSAVRLRQLNRVVSDMARRDELTGVLNRRGLFEEFRELAAANPVWFVALIDIDHFKSFNDQFGHAAGDDCLRHLSRTVEGSIPGGVVFGRLGGEEFAIVMPFGTMPEATALLERVRSEVASHPPTGLPRLTVSIGVARNVAPGSDDQLLDTAMSMADQALYAAKSGGRNRVEVHRPAEST
jgi:diguanylate cyclase (GGDEF)-like protein